MRCGDSAHVTVAEDSGDESGKDEVHVLGPRSRMCRNDLDSSDGLKRAQGVQQELRCAAIGSKGSNVQSKQPFRMKQERKRRTHRA